MPARSSNESVYYRPLLVVIRLEAIWTMRVAYARFASVCVRVFTKQFPKLPKHEYRPRLSGKSGYDARLISISIEDSLVNPELDGHYPDW